MRYVFGIFVLATTSSFAHAAAFVVPTTSIQQLRQSSTFLRSVVVEDRVQTEKPVDAIRYRGDNCDDEYDAIVIGSGIGGMTTASLLAQSKEKLKVLLLEQHNVAGGCCHTFQRGGYSFPTGIHYIGNMHEGGESREMLDALMPPNDALLWDQIDPITDNFDTVVLGSGTNLRHYRIVGGGLEAQAQELKKQFPPETHAAIDEYYSHIERAAAALRRASILKTLPLPLTKFLRITGLHRLIARDFRRYASKTLAEVVNSLTDNEDLRAVMSYSWEQYGCEPSRAAFLQHAVVVKHYSGNAFFPRGGPGNIAKKIIPSITAAGGTALTGAPVKHVVVDEETGRAIGVEMMDGRVIRAKRAVVSDAGLVNTIKHLLPSSTKNREKLVKKYFGDRHGARAIDGQSNQLHEGSSALNLFVGLKGDYDSDFNLSPGQLWAFPSSSVEKYLHELGAMSLDEAITKLQPKDIGLVFISSASCKDSTWKDEHPGRTTLEIMTVAPYKWFEKYAPVQKSDDGASDPGGRPGLHGKEYKKMKEEVSRLIWKRVVDVLSSSGATNLPLTLDKVDYHELGTPLTFAHYYWKEKGGFYGLDHDVNRFTSRNFYEVLRPEIKEIPGLYLTGQDVLTCGFEGALNAGVLSAGKILGAKNPFSLFDDMKESRSDEVAEAML